MSDIINFIAEIQQKDNINAGFIEFPFSTEQLFNKKGQVKIKVIFDNKVEYRGSLVKMKTPRHILGLTKEVRQKLNKNIGDSVEIQLWEDKEERIVEIPDDVMQVFSEHQQAFEMFQNLSYTYQKEYIRWIEQAKKPETRESRKIKMIELILSGKKGI